MLDQTKVVYVSWANQDGRQIEWICGTVVIVEVLAVKISCKPQSNIRIRTYADYYHDHWGSSNRNLHACLQQGWESLCCFDHCIGRYQHIRWWIPYTPLNFGPLKFWDHLILVRRRGGCEAIFNWVENRTNSELLFLMIIYSTIEIWFTMYDNTRPW